MILSHKMEIKPNKTTIKLLNQYIGYSRYCYNKGLSLWITQYNQGLKPNGRKIRDELKKLKKTNAFEWEKSLSPQVLDTAIEDLDRGFKLYFKSIAKHPKFKSKKKANKSCRFYRKNNSNIRIKGNRLYLPKFPYGIKMTEGIMYDGTIKSCTISNKADKWFASFTIELSQQEEQSLFKNKLDNYCGIDLGVKEFAIIASENTKNNREFMHIPSYYKEIKPYYERISYYQKLLSKKKKDSKKYNIMKTKLQKLYLRISNKQKDFLNKLTTELVANYRTICIENLNVRGMTRNHNLADKISKSLFYTFKVMIDYKSKLYNNNLIIADRWYPSTQTCSHCGNRKEGSDKLALSDREYICDKCGCVSDRDENAAFNLLLYGKNTVLNL